MQTANQLVREYRASDEQLHFIDIVPAMLDVDGRPRRDVFKWDGIHLNEKGYAIWTSVVRPILAEAFLESKQRNRPAIYSCSPCGWLGTGIR